MDIPAGTVVEATPYPKVTNLLEVVSGDGTHAYAWEFQLEPVVNCERCGGKGRIDGDVTSAPCMSCSGGGGA